MAKMEKTFEDVCPETKNPVCGTTKLKINQLHPVSFEDEEGPLLPRLAVTVLNRPRQISKQSEFIDHTPRCFPEHHRARISGHLGG